MSTLTDSRVYDLALWAAARVRVLERDEGRCTVAQLLGGDCSDVRHVHHITPVADGGEPFDDANLATVCSSCHPKWEAVRRSVVKARGHRECRHRHRTEFGRRVCERRLNRR